MARRRRNGDLSHKYGRVIGQQETLYYLSLNEGPNFFITVQYSILYSMYPSVSCLYRHGIHWYRCLLRNTRHNSIRNAFTHHNDLRVTDILVHPPPLRTVMRPVPSPLKLLSSIHSTPPSALRLLWPLAPPRIWLAETRSRI